MRCARADRDGGWRATRSHQAGNGRDSRKTGEREGAGHCVAHVQKVTGDGEQREDNKKEMGETVGRPEKGRRKPEEGGTEEEGKRNRVSEVRAAPADGGAVVEERVEQQPQMHMHRGEGSNKEWKTDGQ